MKKEPAYLPCELKALKTGFAIYSHGSSGKPFRTVKSTDVICVRNQLLVIML